MNKSLLFLVFSIGAGAGAIGGGAIAAPGDQIIETNPSGKATADVLACAADCLIDAELQDKKGAALGHREDALAVSIHVDGVDTDKPVYPWSARWLKSLAPKDVPPGSRVLMYVE